MKEASWQGHSTKTKSPKPKIKIEHATTSWGASAPLVVSAIWKQTTHPVNPLECHCGSEPAREKLKDAAGHLNYRIIVDDLREQARSYKVKSRRPTPSPD